MMALAGEKDDKRDENDQLNTFIEMLKTASTLGSRKLDLSRRHIIDIPVELETLQKLEFLYLEGNLLRCLPDGFFTSLSHLKWLDLRNNQLTHLPGSIGESRHLRSLLLEDNQITKLPLELGFVQTLSGLHLAGNPLEYPPHCITEQGTQVILGFLRDEWLRLHKEDEDEIKLDEAASKESHKSGTDEGRKPKNISDQNNQFVERRNSDPTNSSFRRSSLDDETSPFNIVSSIISNYPDTKRKIKSHSASKVKGNRGNPSTSSAKSTDSEKRRKQKGNSSDLLTHNMKRMSTGLLRKGSIETKMQEEMRKAEEKIKNAKIDAIIQQRKNKQELDGWRRETKMIQRQKNFAVVRKGERYAPSTPPFGTHDQKFQAATKHGHQVQNALENLDTASLTKMTRDRDVLNRIDDHIKKLHNKKTTLEKISPTEEVEAARKNLEEALKLRSELEERKALEYRLRAFIADDYAPPSHAIFKK